MKDVIGVILAGGAGSRLLPLTAERAKPAVPFACKYRIADFVIQNFLHSDIRKMVLLAQYCPGSLVRHVSEFWIPLMGLGGSLLPLGPKMRITDEEKYSGTADAVWQHLDTIAGRQFGARYAAVFGADHIYKMAVDQVVDYHKEKNSVLTICAHVVPVEQAANAFGVLVTDRHNRVVTFLEKPKLEDIPHLRGRPGYCLASMGNYIWNMDTLVEELSLDANDFNSSRDFGKDILPKMHARGIPIYVYPSDLNIIDGQPEFFWRDVGDLNQYFTAQMEMLRKIPPLNLIHNAWKMATFPDGLPAARYLGTNTLIQSNTAGGVILEDAHLSWTSVGRSVIVHPGAHLEDSHFFDDVEVGFNVKTRKVICDKEVFIPDNEEIGFDHLGDFARGMDISWLNENEWITVIPKGYKF